jgi:hypothetical protein
MSFVGSHGLDCAESIIILARQTVQVRNIPFSGSDLVGRSPTTL